MSATIRSVDYFYMTVPDEPGAAFGVLARLASEDVNLYAFNAVSVGPDSTQLVLFPDSIARLARAAERAGYALSGPQRAILIRGDDRLGALADVHRKLADAGINVYTSSGVTDGHGSFAYVLYVRSEHQAEAARVLGA